MSLNPDIRDRAYQFFVEEAQELLQLLETGLLELRQDHSIPKVHELMRAAHSIKGGAASVELNVIELLAHRLEDFFKALYSDRVDFDPELESLLLQGYDCLSNPLLEQIKTGSFDEEAALLKAEPVFAALEVRLAEALKNADNYLPSSNDLGVDIVASIFEVDVVQALERLRSVSLNPRNYEPAAELAATLEMFAGFAELFNLSGFSDIVQTAQAALQLNPQAALAIIQVMVADCTLATKQILAGDRERGGTVSLALIELAQSKVAETDFTERQIAFPQDHLGSTTPLTDDVVTDDEIALDSDNWSNVTDNEALAEDIFGNIAEPLNTTEVDPETTADDLSQIFNLVADQAVTAQTETDNDVFTSEEIATEFDHLWSSVSDTETTADNLSQIFNLVADQAVAAQTETDNDVFTSEQILSDSEHPWSDVADNEVLAEDIFGTLADEFSALAIDIEPELAVDDVEQTITNIPANQAESEITTTIESIADIFDSLPSAKPDSLLLSSQSPPKPKAQASTIANTSNTASKLSVRVDLDRLERMNNLVGELTINRNSLALQNEQLQENVWELEQKCWRFRGVTKQLREISDQMLLEARLGFPKGYAERYTICEAVSFRTRVQCALALASRRAERNRFNCCNSSSGINCNCSQAAIACPGLPW
ncbi:MAG: hypothetical protein RLZZ171_2621, partial [Cyanobacteriota bacterium]